MSAHKRLSQLKSVWEKAGLTAAPAEETNPGVERQRKKSLRSPRHGGVMVSVRLRPEEKRRLEELAFAERIPLGELIVRMQEIYEEHKRHTRTVP